MKIIECADIRIYQEFTQAVEAKQIAQQGWFIVHDLECSVMRMLMTGGRCGAGEVHRGKGAQNGDETGLC